MTTCRIVSLSCVPFLMATHMCYLMLSVRRLRHEAQHLKLQLLEARNFHEIQDEKLLELRRRLNIITKLCIIKDNVDEFGTLRDADQIYSFHVDAVPAKARAGAVAMPPTTTPPLAQVEDAATTSQLAVDDADWVWQFVESRDETALDARHTNDDSRDVTSLDIRYAKEIARMLHEGEGEGAEDREQATYPTEGEGEGQDDEVPPTLTLPTEGEGEGEDQDDEAPPTAAFAVTSGSCTVSGNCVRSPNYPSSYSNDEVCQINVVPNTQIVAISFATEVSFDYLYVNGEAYSGTDSPVSETIVTSTISWISDYTAVTKGWELCQVLRNDQTIETSGFCSTRSFCNGVFEKQGITAGGTPFYQRDSSGYYIYYDPDCNAGGTTGRWICDDDSPSTALSNDLDGDQSCSYHGRINHDQVLPWGTKTWRVECDGAWTDIIVTLQEAPPTGYTRKSPGCVTGHNIQKYTGKTVDQCATICDASSTCLAFEYGVDYGGFGAYAAMDCQPKTSADSQDCDGGYHNLDLYVKASLTSSPTPSPTQACDESLSGTHDEGYRGCKTTTISGKTCQKWTSQSPHGHGNTPDKILNKGLGDHNYCRNPDGESTIWCYTTDRSERWEFCEPIEDYIYIFHDHYYCDGYNYRDSNCAAGSTEAEAKRNCNADPLCTGVAQWECGSTCWNYCGGTGYQAYTASHECYYRKAAHSFPPTTVASIFTIKPSTGACPTGLALTEIACEGLHGKTVGGIVVYYHYAGNWAHDTCGCYFDTPGGDVYFNTHPSGCAADDVEIAICELCSSFTTSSACPSVCIWTDFTCEASCATYTAACPNGRFNPGIGKLCVSSCDETTCCVAYATVPPTPAPGRPTVGDTVLVLETDKAHLKCPHLIGKFARVTTDDVDAYLPYKIENCDHALSEVEIEKMASTRGSSGCQCIDPVSLGVVQGVEDDRVLFKMAPSGVESVPASYGSYCEAWDTADGLEFDPDCLPTVTNPKSWCSSPWCYVDFENCDHDDRGLSSYFDYSNQALVVGFSYNTCKEVPCLPYTTSDTCPSHCSWSGSTCEGATTSCTCSPGKYAQSFDDRGCGINCTECDTGTYSTYNLDFCLPCPAGRWNNETGMSICMTCDAGKYNQEEGAVIEDDCKDCAGGKWSSSIGAVAEEACVNCMPGRFSNILGATSAETCEVCGAGRYSANDPIACTFCPVGKWSNTKGMSICTNCIAGKWSKTVGAQHVNVCKSCPVGTWSASLGADACTNCAAGTYSLVLGATSVESCTACVTGQYSETTGAIDVAVCKLCPLGKWSNILGASSCTDCIAGKWNSETGANHEISCRNCSPGRYGSSTGAISNETCKPCKSGTYSEKKGAQTSDECKPCPLEHYSRQGSSECAFCPVGSLLPCDQSACNACVAGRYGTLGASRSCEVCEDGNVSEVGSGSCSACDLGHVPSKDRSACALCGPGRYRGSGMKTCERCELGRVPSADASTCSRCSAGKYAYDITATACEKCQPGMSSEPGSFQCQSCAQGKYSKPGDASCRSCGYPLIVFENECHWMHIPVVLLVVAVAISSFLYVMLRKARLKQKQRLIARGKRFRRSHAWGELWRLKMKTRQSWYGAVVEIDKILEDVIEESRGLGVCLDYILESLPQWLDEDMPKFEWRMDEREPSTLGGFIQNYDNSTRDVPPKEWLEASTVPVPADPNFIQMAPVITYGQYARGYGKTCPRDGANHCSVVDALWKEEKSATAGEFLSWVWSYKKSTVLGALQRWRQMQPLLEDGSMQEPAYIWWCFFCNNQFRMLEQKEEADTEKLAEAFAWNVKRIGKMFMLFDSLKDPKYATRLWCIFEVFVSRKEDIPCSIIAPPTDREEHLEDELVTVADLQEACKIQAEHATASVKTDEDNIRRMIINKYGSFSAVNSVVEDQLMLLTMRLLKKPKPNRAETHESL